MDESNSKGEKQQKDRRFDPELLKKGLRCDLDQYEMLKRCSDKKDMTEWNEWRKNNPDRDIELECIDFSRWFLKGVHLNAGKGKYPHPNTGTIIPDESRVSPYDLQGAVYLKNAKFIDSHLEWAEFRGADLKGADFYEAHLEHAYFQGAYLKGANFFRANLESARFGVAIVDGSTLIWECYVDRDTDFRGLGLDNCRIDPATKQLLEYNIRRMNWEEWYPKHKVLRWPVRGFFGISDYGLRTWRIIWTFLILAGAFAAIYANCACWYPPGIVSYLTAEPHLPIWHYGLLVFIRPIYFSVVTMTTLGFGDMYANSQSIWGHVLLTFQVILGYVLLGALVTRFAVLFTAGGPAGEFEEEN